MAASPKYKVYSEDGDYRASVKYLEDAAILVAGIGGKATIRNGHRKADILYTAEIDGDPAESYDAVAQVAEERESLARKVREARWGAKHAR